jgi:hypothetical protein
VSSWASKVEKSRKLIAKQMATHWTGFISIVLKIKYDKKSINASCEMKIFDLPGGFCEIHKTETYSLNT